MAKLFFENRKMKRAWTNKSSGTRYPMTQIPPEKYCLPSYNWFDYIRPLDKDDIFNWRPKKEGTEIKEQERRLPPKKQ